jgi:retinol dehydrogenase-12
MVTIEGLSLTSKRCLVTGASSGIGLATARAFASLGAELILVGRDRERLEQARAAIGVGLPSALEEPRLEVADLSSLRQTATLAERVASAGGLDILVNCAGIYTTKRRITPEGLETQFAVNYLAPFLLTNRLLPALQSRSEARVITVSSGSHYYGRIHWGNPSLRYRYLGLWAYEQSKLGNVLFSAELARRLGPGSGITVFTADPGLVNTDMGQKAGASLSGLVWSIRKKSGTSPEVPARAIAFLAAEPSLAGDSGRYWRDGRAVEPSRRARDLQNARRLWEFSARLIDAALSTAPQPDPGDPPIG